MPASSATGCALTSVPSSEQPDRGRLGDGGADLCRRLDRFPETRRRRGGQPLDQHLVDRAEPDPPRLDHDVLRRGQGRLCLPAAGRVVAVGQQHDPLLGVVREERGGQPQGGADVGRRLDRHRRDPIDLRRVGRQPLDQRALPERDDPGDVAIRLDGERLAQERERVLAAGVADRIGQVDHEHRRQPIDRQHDLETGQGQDQGGEQHGPHEQRDPAAPGAEVAAGRQVQPDREAQGRGQEQQHERRVEGDPHHALPSAG